MFQLDNYRGAHLTAPLSKVVDRMLKLLYQPHSASILVFCPHQLACIAGWSARDVLALPAMVWVWAVARDLKLLIVLMFLAHFIGCALNVLWRSWKVSGCTRNLFLCWPCGYVWLRRRTARVVVGGAASDVMFFGDWCLRALLQGQCCGFFVADSRRSMKECFSIGIGCADDLHAYRVCPASSGNDGIKKSMNLF